MDNENQDTNTSNTSSEQNQPSKGQIFFQKYIVKNALTMRDRFMAWIAANPQGRWILKLAGGFFAAGFFLNTFISFFSLGRCFWQITYDQVFEKY